MASRNGETSMRVFVDMIENLTDAVRLVVAGLVLCGFLFGFFMTAGLTFAGPQMAESIAEKAIEHNQQAVEQARQAQREREMARDGWGYGSANAGQVRSRDSNGDPVGGWGEEAE